MIRYLGGGQCHPVDEQAEIFRGWLGDEIVLDNRAGRAAFEDLDGVDLFVVAGLHFTGMDHPGWPTPMPYVPMTPNDLAAFRAYVASGRPVLGFHGGVASYNDCQEFGQLIGVSWNWTTTAHTPVGVWPMQPTDPESPLTRGVGTFETDDEIYYNLQVAPYVKNLRNHLNGRYHDISMPLLLTCEGGRLDGSGKVAYFGLGHSMASLQASEVRPLFTNTIDWLLSENS